MGGWIQSQVARLLGRGGRPVPEPPTCGHGFAEAPAGLVLPPASDLASGVAPAEDVARLTRLLRLATRSDDPVALAEAVTKQFGSFASVLAAPAHELLAVKGFGQHSVSAIKLVQEAAHRLLRDHAASAPVLDGWDSVRAYLTGVMSRERIEQFRILFLDAQGRLLADEAQARGTVNHTPVYPREVARRALEIGAASVILVHNHPSGDPTPSKPDIDMTEQVRVALGCFGISVLDHVIIGNGRCFGFREAGWLPLNGP